MALHSSVSTKVTGETAFDMYSTILALGMLLQVAHAAVLYSVEPATGSLAGTYIHMDARLCKVNTINAMSGFHLGGTMVTLRGSGFQRGGIVGRLFKFL